MRLALLTTALLAALAAPAGAQRADPPPVDPAATWALDGTRSMDAEVARGPLELAWAREYAGGIEVSAIGAGRAFATADRAGLVALDLNTGRELWRHPARFGAELGYDGGRVVFVEGTAPSGERLVALDAATGAVAWTAATDGVGERFEEPAVGVGGAFAVLTGDGRAGRYELSLLDAATGRVVWRAEGSGGRGRPVADAERVYVADECGNATAFSRASGVVAWRAPRRSECVTGVAPALTGGRLYVGTNTVPGRGWVYDAATGAEVGTFERLLGSAFHGTTVFTPGIRAYSEFHGPGPSAVEAREAGAPAPRWTTRAPGAFGSPDDADTDASVADVFVAGGTVYVNAEEGVVGLDRATGSVLSETSLLDTAAFWHDGVDDLAAVPGLLIAGRGATVMGLRGQLRPLPAGTDLGTSELVSLPGARARLWGALGPELRRPEGTPVTLRADRFPFRRYRAVRRARAEADGIALLDVRPTRNTRYALDAAGARAAGELVVAVPPRIRIGDQRLIGRRASARVTVSGPADLRAAGREVVLYGGQEASAPIVRLGRARLRGTARRASARVTWRASAAPPQPILVACVKGAARAGFGVRDRLERRCGARTIAVAITA
jgi:outer membrane protein assembly factor BamB